MKTIKNLNKILKLKTLAIFSKRIVTKCMGDVHELVHRKRAME